MTEVKILIEGYAKSEGGIEHASSSTTLIREGKLNIIVDPGMNRKLLLSSLRAEGLAPAQINYIVLTHNHMDHMLLTGVFENAKVFDNSAVYSFEDTIQDHDGKIPGTDIKIIPTPGHDQFHCSVLAKTEKYGVVAIVGDVFWWADNEKQETDLKSLIGHRDPYVKNKEALQESRQKILKLADYIIPGHGKMFKVKK